MAWEGESVGGEKKSTRAAREDATGGVEAPRRPTLPPGSPPHLGRSEALQAPVTAGVAAARSGKRRTRRASEAAAAPRHITPDHP